MLSGLLYLLFCLCNFSVIPLLIKCDYVTRMAGKPYNLASVTNCKTFLIQILAYRSVMLFHGLFVFRAYLGTPTSC